MKIVPIHMKFYRHYPGFYVARTKAVIEHEGKEETISIEVTVRQVPEWKGPEKWAVVITGFRQDYTIELTKLSDIIAANKRKAVEAAEVAVQAGWRYQDRSWVGR